MEKHEAEVPDTMKTVEGAGYRLIAKQMQFL